MKNIKYKNLYIFLVYLLIIIFAPKIVLAWNDSLEQGIESVIMDTNSKVGIRFKNFPENISVNNETNYLFKDSNNNPLNGPDLNCAGINENGVPINVYYNNYSNNDGPTTYIDLGCLYNGKNTLTFGGTYKVCVKNIKSDGFNNPMTEECVDFDNKLILKSAYNFTNSPNEIIVNTNGKLDSQVNSPIYTLKDLYGYGVNGTTVGCYGSDKNPNINSSGIITGYKHTTIYNNSLNIDIGCVLPNNQYKLCISGLQDEYYSSISSEEICVDFNSAPNLLSASMYNGSDKAIKLIFDKEVYFNNGSYVTFKDLSDNVLPNLNNGVDEDGKGKYVLKYYNGYENILNYYADNNSSVDYYKTWIFDPGYGYNGYFKYTFPAGQYQLCVNGLKTFDKSNSIYGIVPMEEQCLTISVEDVTGPYLDSFSGGFEYNKNFITYPNKIILKFNEPLDASAINLDRYMIKDYDTSGDVNPDVNTWKRLSEIPNINITFSNDDKDVNIIFPNNIKLLSNITDFVIGDINKLSEYAVKDIYGNAFINEINNTISNILLTNKNIDLSYSTHIKNITIKSATEIEVKFDRNIQSVSKDEFVIKNNANQDGIVPVSAVIDSVDNSVVLFTIPSGVNNEFTVDDYGENKKNIQLTTTADISITKDLNGWLFEPSKRFVVSENIIFKNSLVKPYIKSIRTSYDQKQFLLEIAGGQIDETYVSALGDSIIISQNINGVEKIAAGWDSNYSYSDGIQNGKIYLYYYQDYYYDYNNDTSYVYGIAGFTIDPKYPFYVKTIPGDSNNDIVSVVDTKGVPLKANVLGIEDNSNSFYSSEKSELNVQYENYDSNNIDSKTSFTLYFNKNIDLNSISTNKKWIPYIDDEYSGPYSGNYSSCRDDRSRCSFLEIKNGIVFDSLTNKITFPGTNIGEIYGQSGLLVKGSSSSAMSDLGIIYNKNRGTLVLIIKDNLDVDIAYEDLMRYVPGSLLKSSSGEFVDKNYYIFSS